MDRILRFIWLVIKDVVVVALYITLIILGLSTMIIVLSMLNIIDAICIMGILAILGTFTWLWLYDLWIESKKPFKKK